MSYAPERTYWENKKHLRQEAGLKQNKNKKDIFYPETVCLNVGGGERSRSNGERALSSQSPAIELSSIFLIQVLTSADRDEIGRH